MRLLIGFLVVILFEYGHAQENDLPKIYKTVIDSISKSRFLVSQTMGEVSMAHIYGDYEEIRKRYVDSMEAKGSLFVICVEPIKYQKSIVTVLKEKGLSFDTITKEKIIQMVTKNLSEILPSEKFINFDKAPTGYSYFGNLFKKNEALMFSKVMFMKEIEVAVIEIFVMKKRHKDDRMQLVVLHKNQNDWIILDIIGNI